MSDKIEVPLPWRVRLYAAALSPRERSAYGDMKRGFYTSKPVKAYARGVTGAGILAWKLMLAAFLTAVVFGCLWFISAIVAAPVPTN